MSIIERLKAVLPPLPVMLKLSESNWPQRTIGVAAAIDVRPLSIES